MSGWRLDGERVLRLCAENGLTLRQLAATMGSSGQRLGRLLEGSSLDALTLKELQRLGDRLGVNGLQLVVGDDLEPSPSRQIRDDGVRLHAALARLRRSATRQELAGIFGWDLARTSAAIKAVDVLLAGTGQLVHRVGDFRYCLRARDDVLLDEERQRADSIELQSTGLDRSSANLLLGVINAGGELPRGSSGHRVERGKLVNFGLVQPTSSGGIRLHPDVEFSLGCHPDYETPGA